MAAPIAKVEFLKTAARPFLVSQTLDDLLDKEVFFMKETYSKGCNIIKEGQTDDHVYLLKSGKVGIFTSTEELRSVDSN